MSHSYAQKMVRARPVVVIFSDNSRHPPLQHLQLNDFLITLSFFMFRQEFEPMEFALDNCPNFCTDLHVPRIQNEGKNIHRKKPMVSYTF